MGKIALIGLLFILVTVMAMEEISVEKPKAVGLTIKRSPMLKPEDNDSSSSSSSSEEESSEKDSDEVEESSESIDSNEQMLCNVLARATHDLHVSEGKSANDTLRFLDNDCNSLDDAELVTQCHEMVAQYGSKIYQYATEGMEMSQVCKELNELDGMDLENDKLTECSRTDGDACRCCQMYVEKRKMRYRFIIRMISKRRLHMCDKSPRPQRCRYWVRREEQQALKKIDRICPYLVCKHFGYCTSSSDAANNNAQDLVESLVDTSVIASSPSLDSIDQLLGTSFTEEICHDHGYFETVCVHLAASNNSHRYTKIYLAILNGENKWIDDDLRDEVLSLSASVNINVCEVCKNNVQSMKSFYLQTLETIRTILDNSCAQCPEKETCKQFFDEQVNAVKSYIDALKSDEFCAKINLCSSEGSGVHDKVGHAAQCDTCVQRLQPHKDAALRIVSQILVSFNERCANLGTAQCQTFVGEILTEIHSLVSEFEIEDACRAMGFCGENAMQAVNSYEKTLVDEAITKVCPKLGTFETACQLVVRGGVEQIQTVGFNITDVEDIFQNCEATTDEESEDNNQCQRCIRRVIQRKQCAKIWVAKYVAYMIYLCDNCPAKQECQKYWRERKAYWDAKIDQICPKKACYRMGYCDKEETPSFCAYLGPFKEVCEEAFTSFKQLTIPSIIPTVSEQPVEKELEQHTVKDQVSK